MTTPPNLAALEELAERYAAELEAQFRTLNLFSKHAGEIGRAHEEFLRGLITRFLPRSLRCGTGFVCSSAGTSPQIDVLVFDDHREPVLFEVGDCVVVDRDAFLAALEVKTSLTGAEGTTEVLTWLFNLWASPAGKRFIGLYAWEGPRLEVMLDCLWSVVRRDPVGVFGRIPTAIYVRSRYLLLHHTVGEREAPPLRLFRIGDGGLSEGQALLMLIGTMWSHGMGFMRDVPGWISVWHSFYLQKGQLLPWPEDLEIVMRKSAAAERAGR